MARLARLALLALAACARDPGPADGTDTDDTDPTATDLPDSDADTAQPPGRDPLPNLPSQNSVQDWDVSSAAFRAVADQWAFCWLVREITGGTFSLILLGMEDGAEHVLASGYEVPEGPAATPGGVAWSLSLIGDRAYIGAGRPAVSFIPHIGVETTYDLYTTHVVSTSAGLFINGEVFADEAALRAGNGRTAHRYPQTSPVYAGDGDQLWDWASGTLTRRRPITGQVTGTWTFPAVAALPVEHLFVFGDLFALKSVGFTEDDGLYLFDLTDPEPLEFVRETGNDRKGLHCQLGYGLRP